MGATWQGPLTRRIGTFANRDLQRQAYVDCSRSECANFGRRSEIGRDVVEVAPAGSHNTTGAK
jgi:hypothetical protein